MNYIWNKTHSSTCSLLHNIEWIRISITQTTFLLQKFILFHIFGLILSRLQKLSLSGCRINFFEIMKVFEESKALVIFITSKTRAFSGARINYPIVFSQPLSLSRYKYRLKVRGRSELRAKRSQVKLKKIYLLVFSLSYPFFRLLMSNFQGR